MNRRKFFASLAGAFGAIFFGFFGGRSEGKVVFVEPALSENDWDYKPDILEDVRTAKKVIMESSNYEPSHRFVEMDIDEFLNS
jgi:hypothetical protein